MKRSTSPTVLNDLRIDLAKIRHARRLLGTKSISETIDSALDFAIREFERNSTVNKAHARFLQSRIQIRDVFGKLEE